MAVGTGLRLKYLTIIPRARLDFRPLFPEISPRHDRLPTRRAASSWLQPSHGIMSIIVLFFKNAPKQRKL